PLVFYPSSSIRNDMNGRKFLNMAAAILISFAGWPPIAQTSEKADPLDKIPVLGKGTTAIAGGPLDTKVLKWKDKWQDFSGSEGALKYQLVPLTFEFDDFFREGQFPDNIQLNANDRKSIGLVKDYCDRAEIRKAFSCYLFVGQNTSDHDITLT